MNTKTSLTEGSIWKSIVFFALPLLFSNIFQQMYSTVDSVVVGRFAGSIALAAVGSSGPLINLLTGFFLGIATGASVVYSAFFGARDYPMLRRIASASLLLGVAAGVMLTVVGVGFAPQLLRMMNTPEEVMADSTTYLRIYFAGIIIMLVYNVGAGIIRATGDSRRPLYYLLASGILNIIGDLILVAWLGMGVAGAAIATVASQLLAAVLVIVHMMFLMPSGCEFSVSHLRWDPGALRSILRLALPTGLQNSMFNISNLIVQAKINIFGATAMAGCAAYLKIDGFIYMPLAALTLALTTFVSQNIGAGKLDRLKKGIRLSVILGLALGIFDCSVVLIFGRPLLNIFTTDKGAVEVGLSMMSIMATTSWVFSLSDTLGASMRGAGAAKPVTIITAMCICVFRIVWLSVLLHFIHDIRVVFFCYPCSWLLCDAVMIIYFLKGNWMGYAETALMVSADK